MSEQASAGDELNPEMMGENPSAQEELGDAVPQSIGLSSGQKEMYLGTVNAGCYCLGDAAAVNTLLATRRYSKAHA